MLEPGRTIAVVGASARAAAFSLLRSGYRVVAADLFADADLARQCPVTRVSPYPQGLTDWLAKAACDAWIYTGALENSPELIDQLAAIRPLVGHSADVVRRVRDPLQLQEVLCRAGLHFPETRLAATDSTSDPAWIGKSYRGSSGSGVGLDENAAYWQRRVDGVSLSAIFRGPTLLGITRQLVGETWAGASEFKYCGSIGPWQLPTEAERQVRRLGEVLGAEFMMTELYGVDLILDGELVWIVEVNPRYTAAIEIVERTSPRFSLFSTCSDPTAATATPATYFGKAILFAEQTLVIGTALQKQLMQHAADLRWPMLADIPVADTKIEAGQPILTVFAAAASSAAVEQQLQRRVTEMKQQIDEGAGQCV